MSTIEANGVHLYYELAGDGPPLVFVHGMCGDAGVWAGQAERLRGRFTCVTYDRRGHSRSSDGEAPHSVELHADDCAALVRALDLAPVVLVGSSGGARIALDVVLRHGSLLAGAVLSEPPIASLDPERATAMLERVGPTVRQAAEAEGPAAAVDAFFAALCPGLWSRLDEGGKARYRGNAPMLFADLGQPSYEVSAAELASVSVPCLLVAGLESDPFLQSTPRVLAAAIPGAELLELADCGHVTYAERPDAFAQAVASFAGRALEPATTG